MIDLDYIKDNLKNVSEVYSINSELLLLKINNAKVGVFTRIRENNRVYDGPEENNPGCFGRYGNKIKFATLEEYYLDVIENKYDKYFSLDSYVYGFNSNTIKEYDNKNVYIIQYNSRYYHILLDILPKLFYLKKIDPDFHLIFLASSPEETIEKSGMFYGLEKEEEHEMHQEIKKEQDASILRYWLDYLNINFTCHNAQSINKIKDEFCFKNLYIFYEKRFNLSATCDDFFEKYWDQSLRIETSKFKYDHYHHPWTHNNHVHIQDLIFLSNQLVSEDLNIDTYSKIYISRKKYQRRHEMEDEIENYFNKIGYHTVYFEDLSQHEQIQICKNAKEVVCYLGSSLVNLMLSKTKALVYVIDFDDSNNPNFSSEMTSLYSFLMNNLKVKNSLLSCNNKNDLNFIKDIFELKGLEANNVV
jgi:hypothetical protein